MTRSTDIRLAELAQAPPSPEASVAAALDRLLARCVVEDASDLHLAPGKPPYYRIHGRLTHLPGFDVVAPAEAESLGEELARRAGRPLLGGVGSLDGAVTGEQGTRYRFNVYRRQGQVAISIRRLEDRFRSLQELGLPDDLYSLCELSNGLIVVAGPTGAGKSTTLAALLDRINHSRRCHVVTIEDPIEYLHASAESLVNQRQVGSDAETFHEALVASLRQDPDVILVGEIRDLNTIRTAITAAETGHLVFTTVHAGDCVGTIERLVSVFPADEQSGIRRQLSLVLRAIIAQHLLICDGTAAQATEASEEPTEPATIRHRRKVASEILLVNPAVANLIASGRSAQIYSAMETGGPFGMHTFEESLARLWVSGQISEHTALLIARNPSVLRDRYTALRPGGGSAGAGPGTRLLR